MGPEMMQKFRDQAERFGTRFITDQADRVELCAEEGGVHTVCVGDDVYEPRTVILAMGAEHKKLGVPGEEELGGAGVSYCATCDAAFFKDRETIIVGGGDSAMEEAIFLAKFSSKVDGRQPPRRVPRVEDHARARARDGQHRVPDAVRRRRVPRGRQGRSSASRGCATSRPTRSASCRWAARSSRSATSRSRRSSHGQVEIDENGYVVTEGRSTRTNKPGVFAAGDLVDHTYRQAITAAGSGCQAALDAEWYLRDNAFDRRRPLRCRGPATSPRRSGRPGCRRASRTPARSCRRSTRTSRRSGRRCARGPRGDRTRGWRWCRASASPSPGRC